MTLNVLVCLVAVALETTILTSAALAAQAPPADASELVYPGAEKYVAEETPIVKSVNETLLGLPGGLPLLSSSEDVYIADVPAEKVAAYYRTRLGGVASDFNVWNAVDPRTLSPGSSTPVHYQRYFASGTTTYQYHWYRKEQNDDIVLSDIQFGLSFSFDPRLQGRKGPLTRIAVTRKVFSRSAPGSTPHEKELGVPIYPGAVYDSHASRIMLGGLLLHVFLTTDTVEAVVKFYEAVLRAKAWKGEPTEESGVNWYFRQYSSSFPEDTLIIQAAEGPAGSYKTRIDLHLNRIP